MASVDVPVALLGYGTVGAAVHRLLEDSADEIERATGHRLRVTHALVRDAGKERSHAPAPGVLTEDFATILDDPSIQVVAEVMGGVDPAGDHVTPLLGQGGEPVTDPHLVSRLRVPHAPVALLSLQHHQRPDLLGHPVDLARVAHASLVSDKTFDPQVSALSLDLTFEQPTVRRDP